MVIDISKSIEECFLPINQTQVVLTTSNEGWNELATNFVKGLTNELNNTMISNIADIIFGKKPATADDFWSLLNSQTWLIVFVSIGAVFSVLTLIGALVTCIWACTCRRSSKGVSSPCMNITGIILALISFGFVVAGVVLYALSTSSFVNGVLTAPVQLNQVLYNVNNFTDDAGNQVSCSVSSGFYAISQEVDNLPKEIIEQFENAPIIVDVLGPNYDDLGKTFGESQTDVEKIIADLMKAQQNPAVEADAEAKQAVQDALDSYNVLETALTIPNNIQTTLASLETQKIQYKGKVETDISKQVQPIADTISQTLNTTIDDVNEVVKDALQGITNIVDQVQSVLHTIMDAEDKLNKNADVNGWITAGFDSIIIVPSAIALFAAIIAFFAGLFYAFKNTSIPSKGCCSASCTLITLSIVVLSIAFIVMIPASFAMTVGYGAQLVCQPFFYDDSLKALKTVDDHGGTFEVKSMYPNTDPVIIKFSEVMTSCKANNPFMKAVKGDQIIDVNVITSAIDVDTLTKDLTDAINKLTIPAFEVAGFETLSTLLNKVDLMPNLEAAKKVDKTNEINDIITEMQTLSTTLQPVINKCNKAADSAEKFADDIKPALITTSTDFVNTMFDDLNTTANQFSFDLLTKTAPCTPVYQSYEDVGMVACDQVAGGIQGMWAAAGLAALFFVPTVIAIFCVASALRGGKTKDVPLLQSHDEDDPFKLPPISNSPVASPPAPLHHDSLPRLTVDTSAAALVAAPHSDNFLVTVPIASSLGGDPWESSYRHPDVYPYDQPVAANTGHFVDPLAYPAAAPAVVAAPYAPYGSYGSYVPYESAGPSAYPRINVSTANRYYDNQGYAPSKLERF